MLVRLNVSGIALCVFLLWGGASAYAQDGIHLMSRQRGEIWLSLRHQASRTSEPDGLHVGEALPDTMRVLPFTRALRKRVPGIRPYSYALLYRQVLIVDPQTKKIVAIVSK
jgi:hypothetical protein